MNDALYAEWLCVAGNIHFNISCHKVRDIFVVSMLISLFLLFFTEKVNIFPDSSFAAYRGIGVPTVKEA